MDVDEPNRCTRFRLLLLLLLDLLELKVEGWIDSETILQHIHHQDENGNEAQRTDSHGRK